MSEDTIRPYSGEALQSGQPIHNKDVMAQAMAHDATLFAEAAPELHRAIVKGINSLDEITERNLKVLRDQMRATPAQPATIVNLHPWELMFPVGDILVRGITVPACQPGEALAWSYLRKHRIAWEYNDDANSRKCYPVLPITLAAEFMREFSNPENDGGGVLIFEGEHNPEKLIREGALVNVYDQNGKAVTQPGPGIDYDENDQPLQVTIDKPVQRPFKELYEAAIQKRNDIYFRKVQDIDRDFSSPESRRKITITPRHRLMAEVLFAEGRITKVPDWNLASRMEEGLMEENCPSCSSPRKQGSYKCANCGNILDALSAYKDHAIEFEHAKMESLTSDELLEAVAIKNQRDRAKAERKKILAAAKKEEVD